MPHTPTDIAALWATKKAEFQNSRSRIRQARNWLHGKVEPTVPPDFEYGDALKVKLPGPQTISLHTVQVMGRKRPQLRRPLIGKGLKAKQTATTIEEAINGLLEALEVQGGNLWRPIVDGGFNHGEYATLCYPATAHWEQFPEYTDESGQPRDLFQRDNKDRAPDDPWHLDMTKKRMPFKMDAMHSKKAYDDYATDWKALHLPIAARVIPAEQCIPIFGPGMRLDGLLVRSIYTEDALHRKGYRWAGGKDHPGPGRTEDGGTTGTGRAVGLYELWEPGRVTYTVGEAASDEGATRPKMFETSKLGKDGKDGPAVIDLEAEYGLCKLLASYHYGAHWAMEENPDERGVPFLAPFDSVFRGSQNVVTAMAAHTWQYGFPGYTVEPTPGLPIEFMMEKGKPRQFSIEPMKVQYIGGKLVPILPVGVGPDVDKLLTIMLGSVSEEGPSKGAFGGEGPTSGHDRSLLRAHLEDSYDLVLDGARRAWQWLGETAFEVATAVARKSGHPVAVYVSKDRPEDALVGREHREITADLAHGVYALEAFYPNAEGENLPYAQMLAEWALKDLVPHEDFLEKGLGDQHPEQTMIRIEAEKFLFRTPAGQQILHQQIAEELGDEARLAAERLQMESKMALDMTPTAAMGEMAGTSVPNATTSAVGGMVAGGIGAQAAANDAAATMATGSGL